MDLLNHEDKALEFDDVKGPSLDKSQLGKFLRFFNWSTLYTGATVGWWEDLNELTENGDFGEGEKEPLASFKSIIFSVLDII